MAARKEPENKCLRGRETLGTEFLNDIDHESRVHKVLSPAEAERRHLIGR